VDLIREPGAGISREIAAGDRAAAEDRLRQPLALRRGGLDRHTYPGRDEDLEAMRRFHAEHGVPPVGFFGRLWWRLRGRDDA
jgi:hypothetical protein